MPIRFDKDTKAFTITTKRTKYVFSVAHDKYLIHQFYGKKSERFDFFAPYMVSFAPYQKSFGNGWSPDVFPQEMPFFGSGDFRCSALKLREANGSCVTDFSYDSYKVYKKNQTVPDDLPHARRDADSETLAVKLTDSVTNCVLTLYYTAFYDEDVIARYFTLKNCKDGAVKIEKCMSLTLDLPSCDLDMISLYGGHYDERHLERVPLRHGIQSVYSRRGASSPQFNPFIALCSRNATEESGDVYGFNLMWSGSFLDEVEVDQTNHTRVQTGLGEENFGYLLESGESFSSPEAIVTYSPCGLGNMKRNLHDFIRRHVLPEVSTRRPHPVVLNTWEACYFDIDEEKLVKFAKEASSLGIDMLVMDDGWFGKRKSDWSSLGDWYPTPEKFKHGLKSFAERVKAEGISFGIWIEPEMINPDSDLYRAHPDWALSAPGRTPAESRQQLVLDTSREDVLDYLKTVFKKTFDGVPIDYFKWDANRHLSDVYSNALPPERQDEVAFRCIKGTYALLKWFAEEYPDAVIETCAGGGGRYDLGMMQHGFQIWASDNTWPYSRTWMQSSALLAYPAATMSCHVANPNGDLRALDFKYKVAVGGMLGYELNILDMSDEIKSEIAREVREYKTFEHVIRCGDYFELVSPFTNDHSAYYYASKDRSEILLSLIEKENTKPGVTKPLKIKAAKESASYTDALTGKEYDAEELRRGIRLSLTGDKDTATLIHLVEKK